MNISPNAPVAAESRTEIDANPDTVWDLLVHVERWPDWNPEVRSASLEGGIREGSVFRWKTVTGTIASTLQALDRPRSLAWTGRMMTIKTMHVWTLEPQNGKTVVTSAASFEGAVASVLRLPLQKLLQKVLRDELATLKQEAERRASG